MEDINFPITELTDDLFESEKVFHAEYGWDGIHRIKQKDLHTQGERILIDSDGYLLKVVEGEVIKRSGILSSFFGPRTLTVKFHLKKTGEQLTLDEFKQIILRRKHELFHITHNKLLTVGEFVKRVNNASTFKELIEIASFEQDALSG